MRRLYVPLGLLALLAVLCTVHTAYLSRFTGELSHLLSQAQERVEREDWEEADRLTRQAKELWTEHEGYLHTTLRYRHRRHSDFLRRGPGLFTGGRAAER